MPAMSILWLAKALIGITILLRYSYRLPGYARRSTICGALCLAVRCVEQGGFGSCSFVILVLKMVHSLTQSEFGSDKIA